MGGTGHTVRTAGGARPFNAGARAMLEKDDYRIFLRVSVTCALYLPCVLAHDVKPESSHPTTNRLLDFQLRFLGYDGFVAQSAASASALAAPHSCGHVVR